MNDLLFVDTNILIYAMDPDDPTKRAHAAGIVDECARQRRMVTSPQTLTECYRVLTGRRQIVSDRTARDFVRALQWSCTAPLDWLTIVKAWEIADSRNYHWWDCLMLASAVRASATVFVTGDLKDGDDIDGMRVVNPFKTNLMPLLAGR